VSEEINKETARDALEMRSVFAPGHYFFCRRIELPSDVEGEEIADYVSLQLESLAPFPIEHLQYGYATDREGNSVFVYAAYRRRFESGVVSEWAKMEVVVPDFVIALLEEERAVRDLCLAADESVFLIKYDAQSRLPASIQSFERVLDEEGEYSSPLDTLQANGKRIEAFARIKNVDAEVRIDGQDCYLSTSRNEDGAGQEFTVRREDLWSLDIRDADTIAANKADERKNNIFWKAVLGTVACIALLLLGELFYGGFAAYASYRRGVVAERQPLVNELDGKGGMTKSLEDFQDATLAPFDMLRDIEPFRPEVVYFTKVASLNSNQLEVTGFAPSQAMVNQFKARVERAQRVETVEVTNSPGQASGVRFTAVLTFKPGPIQTSSITKVKEVANG